MHSILVANPKGGCGKSTLAACLAGFYAVTHRRVALLDLDPQGSCQGWLERRPEACPQVGTAGFAGGRPRLRGRNEILVIDSPAGLRGKRLEQMLCLADTLLLPVLPSIFDMRAAESFLQDLDQACKRRRLRIKVALVANRVREDTLAAARLDLFLEGLRMPQTKKQETKKQGGKKRGGKIPFPTILRSCQNYVLAMEKGLSVFELAPSRTLYDRMQWKPLLNFLERAASRA